MPMERLFLLSANVILVRLLSTELGFAIVSSFKGVGMTTASTGIFVLLGAPLSLFEDSRQIQLGFEPS